MSDLAASPDNDSGPQALSSAPQTVVEREQWVVWRYEQNGDKKPPYDPETGEKASTKEPETWSDFETVINQAGDYDGVGFVLTEDDPIVGIDFDYCRDPETGDIEAEPRNIIERLDCYTEVSPSGTGLHALVIGEKPDDAGSRSGGGLEVYDSGQYFTFTGDHLDSTPETIEKRDEELRRVCETYLTVQSQSDVEDDYDTPDFEESESEHLELGKVALKELQSESTPTFRAVMDFMQGGIADYDDTEDGVTDFNSQRLTKDNGLIDRSSQEQIGISLLYSTLSRYLDETKERLTTITWSVWTRYCREYRTTDHSQPRRWLEDGEQYRNLIFKHAIASADPERFEMMVENKGAGTRRENNKYSQMTYRALWDALCEHLPDRFEVEKALPFPPPLYNDMDPESPATAEPGSRSPITADTEVHDLYPGKSEVIDRAYAIDDEYNKWKTYEEAFRRLQANCGDVKVARIGNTWVYYPSDYPDPPEANYVLQHGEKYDPEVAEGINSWTGEPVETDSEPSSESESELMTDGGVVQESRDELERIRQVRDGESSGESETEILVCPVEGCSRTVVGEPANLIHHVRQSGDDSHRFKRLTEDLEVVINREEYHAM